MAHEVLLAELTDNNLLGISANEFFEVFKLVRVHFNMRELFKDLKDSLSHSTGARHCEDHGPIGLWGTRFRYVFSCIG